MRRNSALGCLPDRLRAAVADDLVVSRVPVDIVADGYDAGILRLAVVGSPSYFARRGAVATRYVGGDGDALGLALIRRTALPNEKAHSVEWAKSLLQADGERFELSSGFNPTTRFPGVRLKPLGHPSRSVVS